MEQLMRITITAAALLALTTTAVAFDYTRIPAEIESKNVIWADNLVARPWTYVLRADIHHNWAPAKLPARSVNEAWGPPDAPWKGMCTLGMKCPD